MRETRWADCPFRNLRVQLRCLDWHHRQRTAWFNRQHPTNSLIVVRQYRLTRSTRSRKIFAGTRTSLLRTVESETEILRLSSAAVSQQWRNAWRTIPPIRSLLLKSSRNVTSSMRSMNCAFSNSPRNTHTSWHSITSSIYLPKRFWFSNSKCQHRRTPKHSSSPSSAKQGDLQLALEVEGCLDEPRASHVTKQVLDAVAFLHENKVVHLDIKVSTCRRANVDRCSSF